MKQLPMLVIIVLATAFIVGTLMPTSSVAAQDATLNSLMEQMKSMQAMITRLESRIAAIEAGDVSWASSAQPRPITPPSAGMLPQRVMQLTGVETVKADATELLPRIEELEAEADALQRTADSFRERISSLAGQSGGSGDAGSRRDTSASHQRVAFARLMSEYTARAKAKRGEATRMRRELSEPRQIVTGVFAGKTIKLQTDSDLSCGISKVGPGQYLTWEGRRESLTENEESWRVTEIAPFDLQPDVNE